MSCLLACLIVNISESVLDYVLQDRNQILLFISVFLDIEPSIL